jgi:hypothetical protein
VCRAAAIHAQHNAYTHLRSHTVLTHLFFDSLVKAIPHPTEQHEEQEATNANHNEQQSVTASASITPVHVIFTHVEVIGPYSVDVEARWGVVIDSVNDISGCGVGVAAVDGELDTQRPVSTNHVLHCAKSAKW